MATGTVSCAIVRPEIAALHDSRAHRREQPRADEPLARALRMVWIDRLAVELHDERVLERAAQRVRRRRAHRCDAVKSRAADPSGRSSPCAPRRRFGYSGPRNVTSKIRRFSATNPGSVLRRFEKPRTSQPAPATSMIASAISATVMTLSQRAVLRPPLVDRLLSFSSVRTSVRASRSAGAKPTKQAGDDQHDEREHQDAPVERHGVEARQLRGADRQQGTHAQHRRRARRAPLRRPRATRTRSAAAGRCDRARRRAPRARPSLARAPRRAPAAGWSRSRTPAAAAVRSPTSR